jgi:hypothetical protein
MYALCVVFMSVYKNLTSLLYIDVQLSSLYMKLLSTSSSCYYIQHHQQCIIQVIGIQVQPDQNSWHSFVIDGPPPHSFVVV